MFLTFILNIPRIIFASIMAIICLPCVGIAYFYTHEIGDSIKKDILAYQVNEQIKLYFMPDLPTSKQQYPQNTCFYIIKSNQFFYINEHNDFIEFHIENMIGFKQDYKEKISATEIDYSPLYGDDLQKYSSQKLNFLNNNFVTIADVLENVLELEDITHASIETEPAEIIITFKDFNEKLLTKFSLYKIPKDEQLLQNLETLNIGGVGKLIEKESKYSKIIY